MSTAADHQEQPPRTAGETTQLGDEEERQQPHDEGATRNQHQQRHTESTPNDAEQQEADGVKSPDREHPAEDQLNRQGNTGGGSDHSSYADALKSPPPQTSTGGVHTNGHIGESPERAPTVTTGSRKRTRCTTQTSTAQKQLNICDGDTDHTEQVTAPHEHQQHSPDKSARGVADCKGQDTKITNRPRPKGSRLGTSRE